MEIGRSIHSCLRTARLNAAAALLSSGMSVTEAAYTVGFDNLSHFSKAFRQEKACCQVDIEADNQSAVRGWD